MQEQRRSPSSSLLKIAILIMLCFIAYKIYNWVTTPTYELMPGGVIELSLKANKRSDKIYIPRDVSFYTKGTCNMILYFKKPWHREVRYYDQVGVEISLPHGGNYWLQWESPQDAKVVVTAR